MIISYWILRGRDSLCMGQKSSLCGWANAALRSLFIRVEKG